MCLAVPGQIESIEMVGELAITGIVNFGGVRRSVNLTFVPEAGVGDYVLVHVGVALCKLDEAAAERSLRLFETLIGSTRDEIPG
jgi:hydrogenase expression/formation protein HypC